MLLLSFFVKSFLIPYKEKLTVRAEAVMTYEEFNRIVETMGEDASRYKNPRNLATGTVRRINGEDERTIELFVFQCVDMKGKPKHVMQQFRQLEEWGFQVVGCLLYTSWEAKTIGDTDY